MISPMLAAMAAAAALAPAPAAAQSRDLNTFFKKNVDLKLWCGGAWQKCCYVPRWSGSGGNGCDTGLACNDWGKCVPPPPAPQCGDEWQECCDWDKCHAPFTCAPTNEGKRCVPPPPDCGGDWQPCCEGDKCDSGFQCQDNKCMVAPSCGDKGEACCDGEEKCDSDHLVCGHKDGRDQCLECGGDWQPCCEHDSCNDGFQCQDNKCMVVPPCGDKGEACCDGEDKCDGDHLVCGHVDNIDVCLECGGDWQPCCENDNCDSGLQCQESKCMVPPPPPCGDKGEACCDGEDKCEEWLTCGHKDGREQCLECGAAGEQCCADGGAACEGDSLVCKHDKCLECGGHGEFCCEGDTCGGDFVCTAASDGHRCTPPPPAACGAKGEACCESDDKCDSDNLVCGHKDGSDVCLECGGDWQPCCEHDNCNTGFQCQDNKCMVAQQPPPPPCGAKGEACCTEGDACDSAHLVCGHKDGRDQCVACGGDWQPCCEHDSCNSGFHCQDNKCMVAPAPPPPTTDEWCPWWKLSCNKFAKKW